MLFIEYFAASIGAGKLAQFTGFPFALKIGVFLGFLVENKISIQVHPKGYSIWYTVPLTRGTKLPPWSYDIIDNEVRLANIVLDKEEDPIKLYEQAIELAFENLKYIV